MRSVVRELSILSEDLVEPSFHTLFDVLPHPELCQVVLVLESLPNLCSKFWCQGSLLKRGWTEIIESF